ncbi:MAG: hypothetical protein EBX40_08120, partial [Gammaproteobacteria bacterium]|nr:hypothetical protein [Gammaproteobacteria bacterium]
AEGSGITLERLDTIPTGDVSVSKVLECEQAFPYPGPMVQENSEYPVVSDKITVYSGVPQAGNHTSFFGETAAEMVQKDACISSSFDTMTIVILSIISALFVAGFVWAFRDTSKPKPNNASTHPELSAPLLSAHQNPAEATTELQHSSTDPQV